MNEESSKSLSDIEKHITYDVKLNNDDKDPLFCLDDENSCSSSSDKNWVGVRATHGVKSGKYYYEATVNGKDGICRFGWSTMAAHLELGKDTHGYGYGGTSMKSWNNTFEKYGTKFGFGDVVGCYIDLHTNEISYSLNGTNLGLAFKLPSMSNVVYFPTIALKNCSASINFGKTAFKFAKLLKQKRI
jgi:ATP-dependent RNA helicase DDX1